MNIEQRVIRYIENEHLFSMKDKVLVALSGGADSVALLRILNNMGYNCEAAHCNFQLRGNESDRDERFVCQLCSSLNIPLHIVHFNTNQYAKEKRISIEMAARELRYEWFQKISKEREASVIAVAHHKDDSVETILLNLLRGTGINGLLGIRPILGKIVRPLLCVNRQEIVEYLKQIEQTFVTDSTNLQDEYTRNKIRLNLLPLMEEINPSIKDSLIHTGDYLNDAAALYNHGINEGKKRVLTEKGVDINKLLNEPSPKALLFEILYPLGFNSAQVRDVMSVLNGQSGKLFHSKEWLVIKDRDFLLIEDKQTKRDECPPFELIREELPYSQEFIIPHSKDIACFDADKLSETIVVRKWATGDSFIPFGMKGKKKVSDYFTDHKFSLSQKERQWVMCCGDKIAWLIGERTDNRFRIDEKTQRIIKYTIK